MLTACGRPQGGGGPAHVDACGQGEGVNWRDFFVDVINGWPLSTVFDIKKYEISHINAFIRALPPVKSILSKYNS